MTTEAPCHFLDWDSAFFHHRIARANMRRLDTEALEAAEKWCGEQKIECLYFLADSEHDETVRLAESNGFQLVDVRITLSRPLPAPETDTEKHPKPIPTVRTAVAGDIPGLSAIASRAHGATRFYHDARFPDDLCDALYAAWIERSCGDDADIVLVSGEENRPSGYITCSRSHEDARGNIGLLGVAEVARGQGVSRALIEAALNWFGSRNAVEVSVATQGRNTAAQRAYQRCGFTSHSLELWYHRWFV